MWSCMMVLRVIIGCVLTNLGADESANLPLAPQKARDDNIMKCMNDLKNSVAFYIVVSSMKMSLVQAVSVRRGQLVPAILAVQKICMITEDAGMQQCMWMQW